jgi:hypothetical protein
MEPELSFTRAVPQLVPLLRKCVQSTPSDNGPLSHIVSIWCVIVVLQSTTIYVPSVTGTIKSVTKYTNTTTENTRIAMSSDQTCLYRYFGNNFFNFSTASWRETPDIVSLHRKAFRIWEVKSWHLFGIIAFLDSAKWCGHGCVPRNL